MESLKRGIVYAATGERYLREALTSAATAKAAMPNLPVALFTDLPNSPLLRSCGAVDLVIPMAEVTHTFADKLRPIQQTPYEETLYLDTDTYVAATVEGIFDLLPKYDMAAAYEYYRSEFRFEDVPPSCPTFNTGVLFYRNVPSVQQFLQEWQRQYLERFRALDPGDQPAFRYCLHHSDLRVFVLPNEYNFRPYYPAFVGGFSEIKILHDHNPYAAEIVRVLNRYSARGPVSYGPIKPLLIGHWYWMKLRKVIRRRLGGHR